MHEESQSPLQYVIEDKVVPRISTFVFKRGIFTLAQRSQANKSSFFLQQKMEQPNLFFVYLEETAETLR